MEQINYQTIDYPDFPANYVPNVVEIHDHVGLLVKIENFQITVNNSRPEKFKPDILLWLFDGNDSQHVAYAHTENMVLINRIGQLHALSDLNETLGIGE
ncbi:hypothetical protein C7B62_04905 [Pleurocapsa sp. CCALA 161]|uniref:hypothetical protein n=1 Tax=Pleurocapsa sp. CCALA 161 TaxID=2107688 RepID=UPI000D05B267|nr:hypothetical protein [Pleurocapsa sp. CCALA 161]PSB11595.1 hypothetical protein C7B62_04905 [Pleurocapsa sp. CCALA 161]